MYKFMFIVLFGVLVSSCGWVERKMATYTGHSSICVEGVKYIQFTSGASVAYNQDGTIQTCK
jgi:hypothetical protein